MQLDAVILAGGRAARLEGADKASLEVGGAPLLERALAALADADRVVVVGDERPTSRPVLWTRESPAYGGPVAAAYAGLDALQRDSPVEGLVDGDVVVVLAVDMPDVSVDTVRRLVGGVADREGAVLVDGGRRHLAFVARTGVLARVRPDPASGAAMRDLWSTLDLAEVPARDDEARDVDRWSDLDPRG